MLLTLVSLGTAWLVDSELHAVIQTCQVHTILCIYLYPKQTSGKEDESSQTEKSFEIPEGLESHVIGKGGRTIQGISKKTGSLITFKGSEQGTDAARVEYKRVLVSGTPMDSTNTLFIRSQKRSGVYYIFRD